MTSQRPLRRSVPVLAHVLLLLASAGCTSSEPGPAATPTPARPAATASPTVAGSPGPIPTVTPSADVGASPTVEGSSAATPTASPRPAPSASPPAAYGNPVYRHDGGDPAVIRGEDGSWYAFTTNSTYGGRVVHVPELRSPDLVHWRFVGDALPKLPAWAHGDVWGPDVRRAGGRFVLLFAARDDFTGSMQLGSATSATARGPYDPGPRVVGWQHERIDPDVLELADGSAFLYWTEGNDVLSAPFSLDRLRTTGRPHTVLLSIGEEGTGYDSVVEGAWAMVRDGWIYLFTSGDVCCTPNPHYAVSVARSRSPLGPFTRFDGNPILAANDAFRGPGHCSILTDALGQDWIVYHAMPDWSRTNDRMLMIDRLDWTNGWPSVNAGAGPSLSSDAAPEMVSPASRQG